MILYALTAVIKVNGNIEGEREHLRWTGMENLGERNIKGEYELEHF